jgi:phage terminase large subunit-like protein
MPGTPGAAMDRKDWLYWLLLAGRGFGKTRVGAESVRQWAADPDARILLIGPTASDVRDTMVEGPSGVLSVFPPSERPTWSAQRGLLQFKSGATGIAVPASEPERLRGKQFTKFWFDELCACAYEQEAWDQVMFGFRLPSPDLQGIITTTPKPTKVIKSIIANPRTVITRGTSDENRLNLSGEFVRSVIDPYRGTRLGRQEINAEILDDVPGALWTRQGIDATRIQWNDVRMDRLVRIVVAIDPAVSHNAESDETGIIVAALTDTAHVLIMADLSCKQSAAGWARIALAAYYARRADCIVAEVNNGGDLVAANIYAQDPNANFRAVRASRGKYIRAEPVAGLYERGRVHHVGTYDELEDQMCGWTPQGNEASPDRMDALVWAVTELLIDEDEQTQVRQFGRPYEISPI